MAGRTIYPLRIAALLALALLLGGVGTRLARAEVSDAEAAAYQEFCAAEGGELTYSFNADGSLDHMSCDTKDGFSYDFGEKIVICDPTCSEYPPFTGGGTFAPGGSRIVLDGATLNPVKKQSGPTPTPTPQRPTRVTGQR